LAKNTKGGKSFAMSQPSPGVMGSRRLLVRLTLIQRVFMVMALIASMSFLGHAQTPTTFGRPRAVPEIDPTAATAGLAMLAGGILLIRSRRR